MTTNKKTHVAGKTLSKPKARTAKTLVASVLTQRNYSVTARSGKVISRTVTTHRDALKRLADR